MWRGKNDSKYLEGIPEALDWLESLALPAHLVKDNRTHPMFVELGTDKTLYLHRRGSNVVNGNTMQTTILSSPFRITVLPVLLTSIDCDSNIKPC
ncbi:MAG: hypothetical protein KDD01_08925 [Phaeodactylibacter sp.]|nr:hypothetical protein [Phaeodactylibacter sp.]